MMLVGVLAHTLVSWGESAKCSGGSRPQVTEHSRLPADVGEQAVEENAGGERELIYPTKGWRSV